MAPPGRSPADAADARSYEPRPASERALRGLATWLDGRVDTAVIAGAPGAGTTFVLRRFEAQEQERRAVLFSPFLHIGAAELESWLDGLARAAGFPSLAAWLAPAASAPLLLVDEAHTATPVALEELARLRASRAPQLRVCLGGCAGPALERAAQGLAHAGLLVLELPPWSDDDLRGLARSLCALAPTDPAALVAGAEGSPGLLRLAWAELRDRPPAAPLPPAPRLQPQPERAAPEREQPQPERAAPERAQPQPARAAPERAHPQPRSAAPERAQTQPPRAAPERGPEAAPHRRSRLARVPWFHAAALVVGFGLGLAGGWQGWGDRERVQPPVADPPALAAVSAPPPVAAVAASTRHDVQVNARPWAWIRIDGQAVGVTPLVQRGLGAGPHEFEATFPDGRQERRTVEIGPESRFVSFAD